MADLDTGQSPLDGALSRKEKRKNLKKLKRKQIRREAAIREREEEEARANDPEVQLRIRLKEEEEAAIAERERREFEERERAWIEAAERRKKAAEEERMRQKLLEESERQKEEHANELEDGDEWEYAEDGPAEIIWKGNEIVVKKKKVKVAKKTVDGKPDDEDADRPTSNPLIPQSLAFAAYNSVKSLTAQELLEGVAQQIPNFGTEQDKAHCPFHLKTGACRFGTRCSRVHFYPDKSCTLLIKNMYNGPGLAWDQDEGLEYTDEEIERHYEDFYEDVHTEFLKFGELVNFKVCKNGSYHLRGNVYVHYNSLESAILAYNTMNGRYFAGKQITCEFVSVTRWKVAICGEYMKSRLRTCSHGTACNFIHCFRNPGGDYEWADWDNPPPKYWIRKMAVLFGHSDESSYRWEMELEDFESQRDSSRKGTPMHGRLYHSKRSCDEMKVLDRKRDRRSSHSRRDQSERRWETSFQDKSEHSEGNNESKLYCYGIKNHPRSHDSSEDRSEKSNSEKHKKREAHQNHKKSHRTKELSSWQLREPFSDKVKKSEMKQKLKSSKLWREERKASDQLSDSADDGSKGSTSQVNKGLYFSRQDIDAQDRHDSRYYCSNDGDTGKDFSNRNISRHENQAVEKIVRYKTRNHNMKHKSSDERSTSDEFSDRWEATVNISDREETHEHSCNGSSRPHRKARSDGKDKCHRRKRKHEVNILCSDEKLARGEHKKYSRSRTPIRRTTGSEKAILEMNN